MEIDGEEYTAEENTDMDGDGANDIAVVETEDGGYLAFADTDHDGTADVAVEYDADGNPVAAAEYDESTGEWTGRGRREPAGRRRVTALTMLPGSGPTAPTRPTPTPPTRPTRPPVARA